LIGNVLSKVSTTSIGSNSSSSTFYISSDGTKLYVADFNYVTSYNIAANGQLTKIAQQFSSSFSNFMFMNNNGTKIISNSGDVYNEQFQMQKSIGFSNTGMYNFSADGSKIVFGGNNNKIELYDGNSLNKIKSINVEVKNQTVNGLTPFFYNNELYCIVQAFDNNTFQQSVLIIKKTI
jgi:WD40 repeat protein